MKTKTTKVHLWAILHADGDLSYHTTSDTMMDKDGWLLLETKEIAFDIPDRNFAAKIKLIRQTKQKADLLAKIAEIDAL